MWLQNCIKSLSITVGAKKIQRGTLCSVTGLKEITSENECKAAGENLGLVWAHSWNGPNDFPGCLYAEDGRNKVYFNTSPNPRRTNLSPNYAAICEGERFLNDPISIFGK